MIHRCRSKFASKAAGFTLVELIVVLLILTVVVSIVAPSLKGFGVGQRGGEVATQIISLANWARTQSVSEGKVYRLNFAPSGRTFGVTVQNAGEFITPTADFGRVFDVPDGISIRTDLDQHTDGTYIEFRPDGRTDPGRIYLTDKLDNTIQIACLSATELYHVVTPGEDRR